MDAPKSPKGLRTLNEFLEKCGVRRLEWFADVWQANAGKFKIPAYVQNEDQGLFLNTKTKKLETEEQIIEK